MQQGPEVYPGEKGHWVPTQHAHTHTHMPETTLGFYLGLIPIYPKGRKAAAAESQVPKTPGSGPCSRPRQFCPQPPQNIQTEGYREAGLKTGWTSQQPGYARERSSELLSQDCGIQIPTLKGLQVQHSSGAHDLGIGSPKRVDRKMQHKPELHTLKPTF